ncbi:MAG: hypothetical protein OXP28_10780 [Gammaproteobacteria bacterium]|nr:hypothetical protein [Gammaproteobacteria bacterium]
MPLEALSQSQVLAQPWVVIPELFDPAYVGGWSAAEHWDLTEQMFRGVMVFTARAGLPTEVAVQGIPFVLKRTQPQRMFGLSPVWHGRARVNVSDIHRTLVDILAEPRLGGGIRHVQDCLTNYQLADQRNWSRLLNYVARLGNGAVYKRLGFLLERQEATETLLDHCASRLTAGNAKLDPNLPCPRLVKRWRLWVPTTWV